MNAWPAAKPLPARGLDGQWTLRLPLRFRLILVPAALALALWAPARASAGQDDPLSGLEQLAGHQPAQAQRDLERMLQRGPVLDERAQLRVELIRVLIADSQYRADDVLAISERIRERIQLLGDARMQMLLEHARSGAFYELGREPECWAALQEEARQAVRTNDDDLFAQAMVDQVRYLIKRGEFEPAASAIADAQRRVRGPQASAEVSFSHALLAKSIGDWLLALDSYRAAHEKFQAVGDRTGIADSLAGAGESLRELGRLADSIEPLTIATRTYREIADEDGAAIAMLALAKVHAGLGELGSALQFSEAAVHALERLHEPLQLARARVEQAAVLGSLGRGAEALALIERAQPVILEQGDVQAQVLFHESAGAALAALGRYRLAYEEMRKFEVAQGRRTGQLVAHQLAAQRGQMESERLSRENALLREQASAGQEALTQAQQEARWETAGLALGAVLVSASLFAFWRQRRQMRAIARMAETDALTGVLSRRQVLKIGQRLMSRCRRDGRPCAILMLDIDRFKDINDRHGHVAGDRALRIIAETLSGCLRPGDQIGRYGGEEFAVILPGADTTEAGTVAERLRTAVARLDPDWAPGTGPLTISGGFAVASEDTSDFTELIVRADRALYRAKNGGRNRMECHFDGPLLAAG